MTKNIAIKVAIPLNLISSIITSQSLSLEHNFRRGLKRVKGTESHWLDIEKYIIARNREENIKPISELYIRGLIL